MIVIPLTRDTSKVMVGEGALYTAPENTTEEPDATALFAGYADPWVHPGLTNEGVTSNFERDLNFHRVEEQSAPVFVTVNESTMSLATALAEDTLENLLLAMGGGSIEEVAAGAGTPGTSTYTPSDDLDIIAVGFEAKNTFGFFRRMYIPRAVSVGNVELPFRRSESKRMFGATFQSMSDMSAIKIKDKTAAAA